MLPPYSKHLGPDSADTKDLDVCPEPGLLQRGLASQPCRRNKPIRPQFLGIGEKGALTTTNLYGPFLKVPCRPVNRTVPRCLPGPGKQLEGVFISSLY
jgi:hypothetical protein